MRINRIALFSGTALAAVVLAAGGLRLAWPSMAAAADRPAARRFQFTYSFEIPVVGHPGVVKVWLPYPVSDSHQRISAVDVTAPAKSEVRKESKYGNSILFFAVKHPELPVKAEMRFEVTREEYVHRPDGTVVKFDPAPADPAVKRWLEPDKLVPRDPRITTLAGTVTKDKAKNLEKARAIYDYVVSTMKYDKTGTGWGNGDIFWACDAKRGNCTDFHALFIGLCRAEGIPARFSIGFPLPAQRGEGEIGGYHCWAEFYLDGYGWVPVDASEACKNPDKREYFFGAHDENRVQLTQGRDLRLDPPQAGDPLNFLVYPYVEVDGKPFKDLVKKFSYRDLDLPTGSGVGATAGSGHTSTR